MGAWLTLGFTVSLAPAAFALGSARRLQGFALLLGIHGCLHFPIVFVVAVTILCKAIGLPVRFRTVSLTAFVQTNHLLQHCFNGRNVAILVSEDKKNELVNQTDLAWVHSYWSEYLRLVQQPGWNRPFHTHTHNKNPAKPEAHPNITNVRDWKISNNTN